MKDDNYRLIGIYLTAVLALIGWGVSSLCNSCSRTTTKNDTTRTETRDTIYIEVHDTIPTLITEKVVKYVKIPIVSHDTITETDSVPMAVVQKEYSDDSTYTAYVSGIKYDTYPKLDSISVRQREITHTIHEVITITEKDESRWGLGLQLGVGYNGKIEPYIGIGLSYNILQW